MIAHQPNWERLLTDAAYKERMLKRSRILAEVRAFFRSEDFLEVETPTVVALPGMEPHLDPFRTNVTRTASAGRPAAKFEAHLITSPEYAMKKLLAGGLERIFEITRCYRDGEPWDGSHNPEFTMIEWYRANADYRAMMEDTEQLVESVARRVSIKLPDPTLPTIIEYQGRRIDVSSPWPRITVKEAMQQYAGINLDKAIDDPAWFRAEVEARGCHTDPSDTFDDLFFRIFLRDVEPQLARFVPEPGEQYASIAGDDVERPVILCEYPRSMAALAKLKPGDSRYAERFEAYVGGLELCNAFSELNDAAEQRTRLQEEREHRQKLGKRDYPVDEQFLEAVAKLPESSGIALGIDRLVMLLTNSASIRDVLFFPASDLFREANSE